MVGYAGRFSEPCIISVGARVSTTRTGVVTSNRTNPRSWHTCVFTESSGSNHLCKFVFFFFFPMSFCSCAPRLEGSPIPFTSYFNICNLLFERNHCQCWSALAARFAKWGAPWGRLVVVVPGQCESVFWLTSHHQVDVEKGAAVRGFRDLSSTAASARFPPLVARSWLRDRDLRLPCGARHVAYGEQQHTTALTLSTWHFRAKR